MQIFNHNTYKTILLGAAGTAFSITGFKLTYSFPGPPQDLNENITIVAGLALMSVGAIASFMSIFY